MNSKMHKVLFVLFVFAGILLEGCGADKEVETEPVHEEVIANLDELSQENGMESFEVKAVAQKEATAFVLLETWGGDSQGQRIYQVKDGEVAPVWSADISEETVTKTMDIGANGNFYILEEMQKKEEVHTQIKCMTQGSDEIQEVSLDQYVEEKDAIQSMRIDGEGDIYLFFDSGKIVILSEEFKQLREIKEREGDYFIDAARLRDGSIVFAFAEYKGNQEKMAIWEVDKNSGTIKEILQLPEGQYGTNLIFSGNGIYDFYINAEKEILGGSKSKADLTPVIRLQDADILSSEVSHLCSVSEEKLFAIKESENIDMIYIEKGLKKGEEEKEILYLASLSDESEIEKEVADFNKKNKDFRIEVKNYGEQEDPVNSFLIDLASGKEFDLVEVVPEYTDKIMAKEIFADLYPFIDADPTLKREDFYDNLLKAFEYDGKLYQSVSFVHLYGWVTKKSHVTDVGEWNFEAFQNYVAENPGVHIFTDTTGEEILKQMTLVSSDELLDWEQKTCHFETGIFEDMLKFAKQFGADSEKIVMEDRIPALVDNQLLFAETPISVTEMYMYWDALGEDFTVVASPFSEQEGVNLYSTMPQIGMIAKSSRQEGAWQFVRRFFTKEYQDISDDSKYLTSGDTGFPVRKDCVDNLIYRFSATEDYEKDGEWISCIKPGDLAIGWDDYGIEVGAFEKGQEELLRKLLTNANTKQGLDATIQDIILDESKAYMNGEKETDEVAKIIQNRVSTYMNE